MAIKDVQTYIEAHGLVETEDSEVDKPIYRKPGYDGCLLYTSRCV